MPSYIHAWCSDCVRKSSGCGYQCSKLTDAVGPPRCADACMSSMPGVDQFSKATSNNSTFTTLARGLQITFSGVQLTGPFGTWTLPDFGCGGTYSPGHCQSTRCADIRYASDSLGEGCDIYLPDGYASHSDGPSGSGTDHATCTCGPGGGTGDCVQTVTSPLAYATLVDKWYVDTAASSENPAFFCEMSKPLCLAGSRLVTIGQACGGRAWWILWRILICIFVDCSMRHEVARPWRAASPLVGRIALAGAYRPAVICARRARRLLIDIAASTVAPVVNIVFACSSPLFGASSGINAFDVSSAARIFARAGFSGASSVSK